MTEASEFRNYIFSGMYNQGNMLIYHDLDGYARNPLKRDLSTSTFSHFEILYFSGYIITPMSWFIAISLASLRMRYTAIGSFSTFLVSEFYNF